MSVKTTEVPALSIASLLLIRSRLSKLIAPRNAMRPASTGFRLVMIAILLPTLGVGMCVWQNERERNQFIESRRAFVTATYHQAEAAEHEGQITKAARLYSEAAEVGRRVKEYERIPAWAAIDMENAKNKDLLNWAAKGAAQRTREEAARRTVP
jgi:hypothetical protein